jgi:L-lactate dehydrogenase complex protein LldG
MQARDSILGRIRVARAKARTPRQDGRAEVAAYIRAHAPGPRPRLEADLIARFRERALSLSSTYEEAATLEEVPRKVADYLRAGNLPLKSVCWNALADLPWAQAGLAVEARAARGDDLVGITGAYCAIAETGTLMLLSGRDTPAATSLLPETHVAVVRADRVVGTMEAAWQLMRAERGALPRAVNFVSGPSRTADIEQTLTLGAHGPYRVHVVLLR